jgi:hypothetical protein
MTNAERVCRKKKGYDTAEQAVKSQIYFWRKNGSTANAYRCTVCGKFHLGRKR